MIIYLDYVDIKRFKKYQNRYVITIAHEFHVLGKTKDELGPVGTIISGGVAGVTLWTVIFPADVIKSRQQVSY